jgi:hypothetical protein
LWSSSASSVLRKNLMAPYIGEANPTGAIIIPATDT